MKLNFVRSNRSLIVCGFHIGRRCQRVFEGRELFFTAQTSLCSETVNHTVSVCGFTRYAVERFYTYLMSRSMNLFVVVAAASVAAYSSNVAVCSRRAALSGAAFSAITTRPASALNVERARACV